MSNLQVQVEHAKQLVKQAQIAKQTEVVKALELKLFKSKERLNKMIKSQAETQTNPS